MSLALWHWHQAEGWCSATRSRLWDRPYGVCVNPFWDPDYLMVWHPKVNHRSPPLHSSGGLPLSVIKLNCRCTETTGRVIKAALEHQKQIPLGPGSCPTHRTHIRAHLCSGCSKSCGCYCRVRSMGNWGTPHETGIGTVWAVFCAMPFAMCLVPRLFGAPASRQGVG